MFQTYMTDITEFEYILEPKQVLKSDLPENVIFKNLTQEKLDKIEEIVEEIEQEEAAALLAE